MCIHNYFNTLADYEKWEKNNEYLKQSEPYMRDYVIPEANEYNEICSHWMSLPKEEKHCEMRLDLMMGKIRDICDLDARYEIIKSLEDMLANLYENTVILIEKTDYSKLGLNYEIKSVIPETKKEETKRILHRVNYLKTKVIFLNKKI